MHRVTNLTISTASKQLSNNLWVFFGVFLFSTPINWHNNITCCNRPKPSNYDLYSYIGHVERITKSNIVLAVTAATTAWLGAFIFDQLFCSYAGYICEDNYLLPIITQRQF